MQKLFSVGETAKIANITSETLRHYDRIGLIKPSKKENDSKYRYYTQQDIIRINTVRALQQMDLPLQKIKEILEVDDLKKIIEFLSEAEKKADEKIALLLQSKEKINLAKADYQQKLCRQGQATGTAIKFFPKRVIMLSETLEKPTLNNLWGYLSHFYNMITPSQQENFEFEDLAGIYTENGLSRLFAVCIRYENINGLRTLPEGNYLCADCTEENRQSKLNELLQTAKDEHNVCPEFSVQQIVVSGILHWSYRLQIYVGNTLNT